LTTKITGLCRDDLLNDGPPMTDGQFPSCHALTPSIYPSLYDHVQCFAKLQYVSRPATKIPQNFLIGPKLKLPSGRWSLGRQSLYRRLVR